MELGQLKHFLAVMGTQHFARAATQCGITQQALSASIGRLEKDLNVSLFYRGRSGATPTPQAEAFAPFIELALTELHRAKLSITEASSGEIGELSFGVGQTFAGHIVPEAISEMSKNYPRVKISIFEGYAEKLASGVIDGKLDFFVGAPTDSMVSNHALTVEPLFKTKDEVICRMGHPLTNKSLVDVTDMDKYTWLFPSPPSREENFVKRAYALEGLPPPTQFIYSDTIATAQALLSQGNYLLIGQPLVLAPLFENKILTTLDTKFLLPERTGYLGLRRGGILRPCVANLLSIIRHNAKSFPI